MINGNKIRQITQTAQQLSATPSLKMDLNIKRGRGVKNPWVSWGVQNNSQLEKIQQQVRQTLPPSKHADSRRTYGLFRTMVYGLFRTMDYGLFRTMVYLGLWCILGPNKHTVIRSSPTSGIEEIGLGWSGMCCTFCFIFITVIILNYYTYCYFGGFGTHILIFMYFRTTALKQLWWWIIVKYLQSEQFYFCMATTVADGFFKDSPEKVYNNAHKFSQTLGRFTQLPSSFTQQRHVYDNAEDRKSDIRYVIDQAKYQNSLYRNLEEEDHKYRSSVDTKLAQKDRKIELNIEDLKKKQEKQCQLVSKHMKEVYKKHVEIETNKKTTKNEQAFKLRKSLLEFYDKERQRKKQADAKQLNVSSCYQDAVNRLDKIHQKNQEYANHSEREYMKRMARNSGRDRNVLQLSRMKSAENRKKHDVYDDFCDILESKEHKYIQNYCRDLDFSLRAFDFKGKEEKKTKERIHKFIKEREEKWSSAKKRIDEEAEHVPQKCVNIMEKTNKSFFRATISSFKDSSRNWYNKVQENKSMIYENDEHDKDRIMNIHLNMRLRNNSDQKVDEKMGSMRSQAKKLTNEFM